MDSTPFRLPWAAHGREFESDSRNCQTLDASPAEPGGLPLTLGVVPGKKVLKRVRDLIQGEVGLTLTESRIIDQMKRVEVPEDLICLFEEIEKFGTLLPKS
ncbi:MAG: hypothetical protein A3J71_08360 [Pseudomonadales bacterium RIFCSPHIGHO2_02_FULL_60_43]|nr:MAG: hypothetical protein A3J71_08360 [Pseudomonadales bacterium RIFCSPHIGHO2_02_FULL_60_43]